MYSQGVSLTESPLDKLQHYSVMRESGWTGRIITTYRPDNVVDPENPDFAEGFVTLGERTGQDMSSWHGYLQAHRVRREFFKIAGATATDHGHPTAQTADLSEAQCEKLFASVQTGSFSIILFTLDETNYGRPLQFGRLQ